MTLQSLELWRRLSAPRWTALAVLMAALASLAAAPPEVRWPLLSLSVLAVLVGERLRLRLPQQVTFTFVTAFAAIALAPLWAAGALDPDDLSGLSERELLFTAPLLWTASVRALMVRPKFGHILTFVLAVFALAIGGRSLGGWSYPVYTGGFCLLAARASAESPGRRPSRLQWRSCAAYSFILVVVVGAAATAGLFLPRLQDAAMRRFYARLDSNRVGFSGQMALGDMNVTFEDRRVVLRLRGQRTPQLLRGAVFTSYHRGEWEVGSRGQRPVIAARPEAPEGPQWVEIEHARRPQRYFLPQDAHQVSVSEESMSRDLYGIYYPPPRAHAKRLWFQVGGAEQLPPPSASELQLPPTLRRELPEVLATWEVPIHSGEASLRAIADRLSREFRYSLHTEREAGAEPVLDFLLNNPVGHCEYFASSFALLARAAGIPTRLVSGYRVAERSPFGYHIVRKQHAHAWVEAWVEGGWRSYDPTPPAQMMGSVSRQTSLLSALWDGAATAWLSLDDWLSRRSTFEIVLALSLLAGLLVGIRTLRGGTGSPKVPALSAGLPAFVELSEHLRRHGVGREEMETLDAYCRRLLSSEKLETATGQELVTVLQQYARHRYAGVGDAEQIQRALRALCRRV